MYQYAIPLAAITFSYLFGGGTKTEQDSGRGQQNQGILENLTSNWRSGGWGEVRRMMGLETTAEEEEQKRKNKKEEERKKMDEEREKVRNEEYERERKEDQRRSDRRREDMRRAAEEDERESYTRKVLAPPAPRQSHYDDPSSTLAASGISATAVSALINEAMRLPPRPQQVQYDDGSKSWQDILMKSGPYLQAYGQRFDIPNPAIAPSVYPDSGYRSMVNDSQPIVSGRDNGTNYDRPAQTALEPQNGSVDRSRSGGPGSGPDFSENDNVGSGGIPVAPSRGFDPRDGQRSGENADYYSGKYQERRGAYEAPDMMGAMGNRLNDDAKRRGRGQDTRSQDEEYGRRSRSGGGPDFDDAYARNVDSRRNGDGNHYRERSRGDYQDGGRRNLRRSPNRHRAGQEDEEDYDRRRNHADDYDEERRRGRSRAGGSRYDDDEYGVDGRYGSTSRHRTKREERDAYNQRRRLDPYARGHEDHLSHLDDDRNGRHGADGQLTGAAVGAGAAGGTTIINNVLGGFPMTAGVVSSADPAPAAHTSIPEPASEPIQPETVIEEKPTEKLGPVRTERQTQQEKEKSTAELWARANEQRDLTGRRKGNADAGSASQKAEVSNGYTQPEELAAETVTEGSKPRDDGTGMGVPSGSRGSGDSSLKPSDLSDDRDLLRKDKGQSSDRQGTATPTVSSHTVTGQGSESQDGERSRVDSAMGNSPSQTKSSGDRLDEIPRPGSGMDNSSIPPKYSEPQSGNTGYQDDKTLGEQSSSGRPKTSPTNQQDSIPSPASSKDSAISLGYDERNSPIQRPESASPDNESPIATQAVNVQDGAKREHGLVKTGKQRYSSKAELVAPDAAISPVRMAEKEHPDHGVSTSASLLKEPEDNVGMDHTMTTSTSTDYPRGQKRRWAEERMRETTKHAMQAQSSVLKRHNVTGPKTFGRLIKLALKSSPKMAFLSSVVMVIYLIGAVYLGNQVANILQVTAPSSQLSRRQSPRPSSSATSAAADPETSTFSSSTFESFDEDTQMLILINVWHAISWLVLVSLAHYIWENIPDPDGPRTRKNWLDKFGLWSMLRVLVTVAPMSVYLLLGARQLTSCAYLLNDPDAIAWSMGPDVGLTWNYLSENNGRSGSTPATVNSPVQDMGDWQLLLISVFFWLTGIPVLLYSIKRVQYPGSLSRGKIIRKVENRYEPHV